MTKIILFFCIFSISSCAQFSKNDHVILNIEKCANMQKNIPERCSAQYKNHLFNGEFIELRSKFIGDYIGHVTIEIKTGRKSIMCVSPVNEKNLEFLKAMKKGDPIRVSGKAITSTTFKRSYHSYITLNPCSYSF